MMLVRVLGAVEICTQECVFPVMPAQRSAVFAALVVEAGRPVAVDTIVDRVWGAEPPQRARAALHTHVTRIRRLMEQAGVSARLARRAGGYVIEIEPDEIDVYRFRRLAKQADDPGRAEVERTSLLSEALGLWCGEPLPGIRGEWADRVRSTWRRYHVDATLAWARIGEPAAVINPLTELADQDPMDESVAMALMRALAAAGRPAQALDLYLRFRRRLIEELGVEPGPELRDLHRAILRGDASALRQPRDRDSRTFYVQRITDVSASRVADGVVWADGSASLRWNRFEDAFAADIDGETTRLVWLD